MVTTTPASGNTVCVLQTTTNFLNRFQLFFDNDNNVSFTVTTLMGAQPVAGQSNPRKRGRIEEVEEVVEQGGRISKELGETNSSNSTNVDKEGKG